MFCETDLTGLKMDNVISREKVDALISTSVQLIENPAYTSFIRSLVIRDIQPGYVSIYDYIAIWKKLIAHSDDPLLPCKIGECIHISDLGIPGLIMMHSGNIARALRSASPYRQLISNCFHLTSSIESSELKISLTVKSLDRDFDWHYVFLNILSQFIKTTKFLTNNIEPKGIEIARIGFSRDINALDTQYSEYFRCPVIGSQPENHFVFSTRILELPIHNPKKEIFEDLVKLANRSLESFSDQSYSDRVVRVLKNHTFPAMARIDSVAQELNLSVATLKRRLQLEGASFSSLKDSLLLAETQRIMSLGHSSPTYIAKNLGYSDGSSFSKAFKRWTNSSLESHLKCTHTRVIPSPE